MILRGLTTISRGVVGDCQFSDPITAQLNETYRRSLTELARCLKRLSFAIRSSGIQAMTGFNGMYVYPE